MLKPAQLGQAWAAVAVLGLAELRRLQHLRDLLTAAGHDATDAAFGLFSATGFTDELAAEANASKGKILLVTLNDLYDQPS